MVKKREGLSVAQEIDGLEEKLSLCRQSMEEVDLKLRREELSPERRKSLERERSLLVTKAETYELHQGERQKRSRRGIHSCRSHAMRTGERELKVLRQENRKNAAIALAIVLLIIVVYTCWTM
ncbi:coiled-coil domain-containing protein 167 isoform X1 [Gopherus flavomarginatus]|uniref:coiled-coil domain-containing protein 167 isoform X1 n=1 Tax=Gopherus flavomarginatus TaxID=286002 RepID=UPI0021CC207A|nr:coiled-coil domain-containing protein 167 isoform X1 [Gopherus flavomarginatus]